MEQRTDETPRQPGAAAEDTGPPGDEQPGTAPAADETAASNGYTGGDRDSIWDPPPGRGNRDRGSVFPSSSPGSFGPVPAGSPGASPAASAAGSPASAPSGGDSRSGAAYPADSAYTVDDGYGPPGTERAAAHDFPSSSVGSQTFGASPAESIYGSSATPRDHSPSPYPSQVTTSRPEDQRSSPASAPRSPGETAPPGPGPSAPSAAETTRVDRPAAPSAWQAATSRVPRPQQVPKRSKAGKSEQGGGANARQAHLMVSRFEPWSVMKFSFMISLACFVILFVAVALLYATLAGLGVFNAIENSLSNVTSGQGTGGVNISHYLSASTILSYTALLGVLNVFLITAFATVGSLIYNLTSHLIGGVEVTLRETE